MRVLPVFTLFAVLALPGLAGLQAQSTSEVAAPAELPPETYTGRQYVDSKGCVFVRAGVNGAVSWVPRMSRDRTLVCGFKPSLSNAEAGSTAAVAAAPNSEADEGAKSPSRMLEKPAQGQAATSPRVAPADPVKPGKTVTPVNKVYEPAMAVREPMKRARKPVVKVKKRSRPAATRVSRHVPSVSPVRRSDADSETRIAPRRVYARQQASREGVYVPHGYKPAWDDDRLNHRRVHQTRTGMAQMDRFWTRSVPRELITGNAGHLAPQEDRKSSASAPAATSRGAVAPQAAEDSKAKTVVATRSVAPRKTAQAASHRFVRAGVFRLGGSGQSAAQKLANAGLPTRIGKVKSGGKTYEMVLAGPFKTQGQLDAALRRVRAMGFSNPGLKK